MLSLSPILFVLLCTSCLSQVSRPLRGLKTLLSQRVVSTNCQKIRNKPYKGRLDLLFIYAIKYRTDSEFNLLDLNTALSSHLISVLNDCDANGEPIFATEVDPSSHALLTKQDGLCQSPGSSQVQCVVIRGKVAIYLDGDPTAAKERSYSTIQSLLDDTYLLEQLSGLSIVDSFFVRSLGENLVVFVDDSEKEESTKQNSGIVVAATMASLVLTLIFLYGLYRRGHSNLPSMKQAIAHLYNKRRQFFENLPDDEEEEELEPSWMTPSESAVYERCPPPSITWSVSDLTSDSHSIRSTIQLDRIVEEHHSEESAGSGEKYEPPSHIYRHFDPAELDFVPQWNDASSSVVSSHASTKANDESDSFDDIAVHRFGSDQSEDYGIFPLRGCQFLPDASFDESSTTHVSLPLKSDLPLDCSLSPDSTSTKGGKDLETSRDQEVYKHESKNKDDTEIEKRTTIACSATLVLDLTVLLWWVKLWIDLQRGRSEPRLKCG